MKRLKRKLIEIYEDFYEIEKKCKCFILIHTKYRLKIMDPIKTIKYINDKQCSVARYGDGEFGIMMNEGTDFQSQDIELGIALRKVFQNRNDALLICIPRYFNNMSGVKKSAKKYWDTWRYQNNHQIRVVNLIREYSSFSHKQVFGDALITRPYMDMKTSRLADKIFPCLRQLWENREILIIEGSMSRLGVGNDLFNNAKSIKRILAPAVNAFDHYEEIKRVTVDIHNGELVLIALGPTATVLASELSKSGVWAIDIGHIDIEYEWSLRKSEDKSIVPGKYINEVSGGHSFSECSDKKYLNEIVASIGLEDSDIQVIETGY